MRFVYFLLICAVVFYFVVSPIMIIQWAIQYSLPILPSLLLFLLFVMSCWYFLASMVFEAWESLQKGR
jgi:hypothetical protein